MFSNCRIPFKVRSADSRNSYFNACGVKTNGKAKTELCEELSEFSSLHWWQKAELLNHRRGLLHYHQQALAHLARGSVFERPLTPPPSTKDELYSPRFRPTLHLSTWPSKGVCTAQTWWMELVLQASQRSEQLADVLKEVDTECKNLHAILERLFMQGIGLDKGW